MTQTTENKHGDSPNISTAFPLPDVFSSALVSMFHTVQPGIVQVGVGGRGGGTGVVWRADGRVITNHHVVANERAKVYVHLFDGRTLEAQVLHRNPQLDLALLQVHADNLHALPVGDSSGLRVGEWVFAIGHPWGQRWALTAGIMSGMSSVQLRNGQSSQYIKSDVGLAPGNSGGPLLDADGNVVGINAMIFGGDLAVSIPSNVVSAWLAGLPVVSQRHVTLGIQIQQTPIPDDIRTTLQPSRELGLLIVSISAERQARHSDLLVGDILLDLAGQPVQSGAELRQLVTEHGGSGKVPMKILRGGKVVEAEIATQTEA
jgi:serine protease Do